MGCRREKKGGGAVSDPGSHGWQAKGQTDKGQVEAEVGGWGVVAALDV